VSCNEMNGDFSFATPGEREVKGESYMSQRNFQTHNEETKAVKQALADVAILARVRHATGTMHSWLKTIG